MVMLYCFCIIIVILTIIGLMQRDYLKYAILISTVAGIGLAANVYFVATLVENGIISSHNWWQQTMAISAISLILWTVQVIVQVIGKWKSRDNG